MSESDLIKVVTTIKDAVPTANGFGTIGVLAYHSHYVGWRTYATGADGLAAMISDGFTLTEPAYLIASSIGKQPTRVNTFKLYARPVAHSNVTLFTPTDLTPGHTVTVDVSDGGAFHTISHVNGGSETATTICTALEAALVAVSPAPALTGVAAATWTVTATTTGGRCYVRNASRGLTILDTTSTDTDVATDAAAANLVDSDWYGLLTDSTSKSAIELAAAWAEANGKLYVQMTFDTAVIGSGTTDVGAQTQALNQNDTNIFYSGDPIDYANAGIMARQFALPAGSSSWHMKPIAGVQADNLNATELANARGKNVMVYVNDRGIVHTWDGKAGSGRFLDITHGLAWLSGLIADDQLTYMASREKINMDQGGISELQAVLHGSLDQGVAQNVIQAGFLINAPLITNVSTADKGNRKLVAPTALTWSGKTTGGIHTFEIDGTVNL